MMLTIVPCSLVVAGSLRVISTASPMNSEAMRRSIEVDCRVIVARGEIYCVEGDGMVDEVPHMFRYDMHML